MTQENLALKGACGDGAPGGFEDLRLEVERECLNCPLCRRECAFLQKHGRPGEIAGRCGDPGREGDIPFECSLCGLCEAVCPREIPLVDYFLEWRREVLRREPQRLRAYRSLLTYERLGASRLFSWYALPEGCETVFFPGCALPGTRPEGVWELYRHLRREIPALGIVLDCCGKPSHDLGHGERFEALFFEMRDYLHSHGVKRVLTACPNCQQVFRRYAGSLGAEMVYERLASAPLPLAEKLFAEVTVHDPCVARRESGVQGSVRQVARRRGLSVSEMPHTGERTLCCGEGGAVGFLRPELAEDWKGRRVEEAAGRPVLTYCAGCAERLGRGAESLHVLDLIAPGADRPARPLSPPARYLNRLLLKRRLRKHVPAAHRRERRIVLEEKGKGKLLPKIALFGAVAAAVVAVRATGGAAWLEPERLQALMAGYGVLAPLLYMGIYALAPALFLPGLPLTVLGGILFGPLWGVVYTIVGATVGATIAFLVARYLGRDWIADKIRGTKMERLDQEVERHGWKVVAFTRLIPLFPFNLLNYAFGLTRIGLAPYVAATFVCMLPACIAFIVFSSSLLDVLRGRVSPAFLIGLLLVAGVSLVPVLYRRRRPKGGRPGGAGS